MKLVFGRTKLVDSNASLSDYLFTLPTRQSCVLQMREKIFEFLMKTSKDEDVFTFKNSPVVILRDARQLPDVNNLLKKYYYKFQTIGPNPNGSHTVNAKKSNY